MNKTAIKQFATSARRELISAVMQRAQLFGIVKGAPLDETLQGINGKLFSDTEKTQRRALIEKIKRDGFDTAMEEVAYTWFNRFTALRFMEVNGYLPSYIRVFTDSENRFKPQILSEALELELDRLDKNRVRELKLANKEEELYKYLLITQCNALNSILPRMFQQIEDYTELLFPDYILRKDSILDRMISQIPQEDFDVSKSGQIEIIGWFYQYYVSEKHDEVIDALHGNGVKKEDIAAATQLFTTDWVVRYILDNSVGRYWLERHPESKLKDTLKYLATPKSGSFEKVNETITPQELTVFDPSVGSGHFLVYAFEILMQIYTEQGYSEREAAQEIVKNNLYGLDIDERATQLAYFAVMMKARQYDSRFFARNIQPHLETIIETEELTPFALEHFTTTCDINKKEFMQLYKAMCNAKETGSVTIVPDIDYAKLKLALKELSAKNDMFGKTVAAEIYPFVVAAEMLNKKYTVVATNPPYLSKYSTELKKYLSENYDGYTGDMFSVFIFHSFYFCKKGGYTGFMTPFVWMFIKTYEYLRKYIIFEKQIATLIQFEYSAYEEATVPICTFVLQNSRSAKNGLYFRLSKFTGGMEVQRQKFLEALANKDCGYFYEAAQANFSKIPGSPIGYWVSENFYSAFDKFKRLDEYAPTRMGISTGDNNRFLRFWHEPDANNIKFNAKDLEDAKESHRKWFPYNKGGEFRRWYGNIDYVVNWENNGQEIRNFKDANGKLRSRLQGTGTFFKRCVTWGLITSNIASFREITDACCAMGDAGPTAHPINSSDFEYILACLNTKPVQYILTILNPTINLSCGVVCLVPIPIDSSEKEYASQLSAENVALSKSDWDSFETSWDFARHPLVNGEGSLAEAFGKWERECRERFDKLKANEEELNRIFIGIYGLEGELTPEVEDRDVTVRLADRARDVRSLISYAVGCMFGRYSLDADGLVFAGGDFCVDNYRSFAADRDAIIPVCDDDYFSGDNDIVGRFVEFLRVVYGEKSLEENLRFVAEALGGSGDARDVIRNYFLKEFYADHLKVYQKRPIYWLFDSGKKNGFKALVYLHRYTPDTLARLRTDYVHELQRRYASAIEGATEDLHNATASQSGRLNARLKHLREQSEEIRKYEELVHHLADRRLDIDLDNGVKFNYALFGDALAKIK